MPWTRGFVRRAPFGSAALVFVLSVLLMLAACDLSSSPTPSAVASATSVACGPDEIAAGGINGSVVDPEGNPLNDIFIAIEATGGFRGDTRTGEDGVFTSPGVSGEFRITTTDIDYGEVVRRVTVPCGELVDVELVLTRNEE